jgi:energy-coupling factor transporter ATP-binding protein EcfA2
MKPSILVLDEPTVGQDGFFLETLASVLSSLKERGVTVLLVTHDIEFAGAVSDQWIVVHEGKVVADGAPDQLVLDDELVALGAMPPNAAFGSQNRK